jgi:hypothetical protein
MNSCPGVFGRITFGIIILLLKVSFAYGQTPVESDTSDPGSFDTTDLGLKEEDEKAPSFWTSYVFGPLSFKLSYEAAYKVISPDRVRKNRFALGLKYSKSLSDHFSLQLETKLLSFLKSDHRTRKTELWINDKAETVDLSFGSLTRDAYVQASFNKTSIKAGMHTLDWGESDFAIVTNEISPLDYREPLNLNVDELRFAQLMLLVDQYTTFGNWTAFFIPYPRFNQHPKKGTAYYVDPFKEEVEYKMESENRSLFEYGMRWKKTFGKSDISVMAARLVNNEYALRLVNPGLIAQSKSPYTMGGVTFNYAIENFLIKGESAIKFSKTYNDASFQIVKKNAFDASLGVDYSPGGTLTLGLEAVNYHIMGWNDGIQGMPRNNYMLLFILGKKFMNDDLSVNCVTMYNGPYTNFFNLLTTSYNWRDHIELNLSIILPVTNNINSGFYSYRDEKQIAFKVEYQF